MKDSILLFLCMATLTIQAQDILWQRTLGGSLDEIEPYTYIGEGGQLYVMGSTNSTDFAPLTGIQANDGYYLKMDSEGGILEGNSYGGSFTDEFESMCVIDGEYYFLGTGYSMDGDVNNDVNNADAWLLKADAQGLVLWSKLMGGTAADFGMDLKPTSDGGVVCAVFANSDDEDFPINSGSKDSWVIKVDSDGETVWSTHFGTTESDRIETLLVLNDGGILCIGYTDVSVGGVNYDYLAFKLDENGDSLWTSTFGSNSQDAAFDGVELVNGDIFIGGYSQSASGDVTSNYGGNDAWVIRISATGELLWEHSYGGSESDMVHSLAITPWNTLLIAGSTSSIDHDIIDMNGDRDYMLLEVDMDGELISSNTYGGTGFEYLNTVSVTPAGKVYLSGKTTSDDGDVTESFGLDDGWLLRIGYPCGAEVAEVLELDSGQLSVADQFDYYQWYMDGELIPTDSSASIYVSETGTYSVIAYGEYDCYTASGEYQFTSSTSVGLFDPELISALLVYPNPAKDHLYIEGLSAEVARYEIRSLDGRVCASGYVEGNRVELSSLSSGSYLLRVDQGDRRFMSRLTIQ